jgi:phosphotransferase system HPr-like phosphotransfer protein
MSYTQNTAPQLGAYSVTITGGTATAAGGQAAILNPAGVPLIITDAKLYVTANSTGAANLTIGTAAAGTVAATSMMGATAMGAAAGKLYQLAAGGTAAAQDVSATNLWGSADYINVSASASAVGLSAILYIDYWPGSAA